MQANFSLPSTALDHENSHFLHILFNNEVMWLPWATQYSEAAYINWTLSYTLNNVVVILRHTHCSQCNWLNCILKEGFTQKTLSHVIACLYDFISTPKHLKVHQNVELRFSKLWKWMVTSGCQDPKGQKKKKKKKAQWK